METCARCGKTFGCGMKDGASTCWCAELPPALPVPVEGEGACLCPDCLKAEIARAAGRPGPAKA